MINRRSYHHPTTGGRCTIIQDVKEEGEGEKEPPSRIVKNNNKRMSSICQQFKSMWTNFMKGGQSHYSFYYHIRHQLITKLNDKSTIRRRILVLMIFCLVGCLTTTFFNDGNVNYASTQQRRLLLNSQQQQQQKRILVDWNLWIQQQQREQQQTFFRHDNNNNSKDDDHTNLVHEICSNRKVVNLTTTTTIDSTNNKSNPDDSDWTIVMTINDGYYDFFINWYHHYENLQQLNNNQNLVLFAEDSMAYIKLLNFATSVKEEKATQQSQSTPKITVVYTGGAENKNKEEEENDIDSNNSNINLRRRKEGDEVEDVVVGTEAFDANSPQYTRLISMRPSRLLSLLCTGRDVLYVDVDTVWKSNPLVYLKEEDNENDETTQRKNNKVTDTDTTTENFVDGYLAVDVRKIPKKFAAHGVEFCTGFAALKATITTLKLVSKWELSCQSTEGGMNDQQIFNKVYHHLLLNGDNNNKKDGGDKKQIANIQGLPRSKFPNGEEFFVQFSENDRKPVVQVHANFMVGKETKKKKLQEYGLWDGRIK